MKSFVLSSMLCLAIASIFAQKRAVTELGEEVVLYDDGTWVYVDKDAKEKEIVTNSKKFKKSKESTFLLKSNKNNLGFWLNPKLWSFSKGKENPEAEYELELKGEDLYGLILSEKVEIPLEALKNIALENCKSVAPDTKVISEEYRYVNGLKVLQLQMNGTLQGIKFSYLGYYYSNAEGTVQFMTYTSQNLLNTYRPECEKLLNGLVELK